MRTTLRTPVTPTRDRLTWTAGRRACTSVGDPVRRRLTAVIAGFDDSGGKRGCDLATSGVWWPGVGSWRPARIGLAGTRSAATWLGRRRAPSHDREREHTVDPKDDGALLERPEPPIAEIEELRPVLAEARERGYVTFEDLAASLEEVEVTKEQLRDLRTYLVDRGIELLAQDGKPAEFRGDGSGDGEAKDALGGGTKKIEIDLTVEPSLEIGRATCRGRQ